VLADQWSGLATAWQHALQRASRLEPREGLKLAFSAQSVANCQSCGEDA
jgi:hypothetical protein